ncbi:MAG: amidohydrolase [Candidatus Koribacter versatilis]|nr:amidohydrolase [Candidatus Koribacter versatilis]
MNRLFTLLFVLSLTAWAADPWSTPSSQIDAVYPQVESLYLDLHRNPELSFHEEKTAAKIAEQLRKLGYDVTTEVGGTGVVGVLKNGSGPTVMLRAELDALPVPEKTGLAYASHVTTKNDQGVEVPVMHACGHDLHMAIGIGTAALLAQNKDRWRGTFIYVGQPAEERVGGAKAMMKDGLFTRFPKPDFAVAVHDTNGLPAGKVSYTPGFSASNSDSVDITVYGVGGHGSAPQTTVDPIVIAARTIVTWQTIVAREIDPQEPAVITVGSIHGGTKHNIIPDEVHMQLTVRSYKDEVRKHLLAAIERIAVAEAAAAGAPKKPLVQLTDSVGAVYNDPQLTNRLAERLQQVFGVANVQLERPMMWSDDFAEYRSGGVPSTMIELGAVNPAKFQEAKKSGESLPSPHSPFFAPDREPSLKTGIAVEMAALLELLGKP